MTKSKLLLHKNHEKIVKRINSMVIAKEFISNTKLSKEFGCSPQTIYNIAKSNGIDIPGHNAAIKNAAAKTTTSATSTSFTISKAERGFAEKEKGLKFIYNSDFKPKAVLSTSDNSKPSETTTATTKTITSDEVTKEVTGSIAIAKRQIRKVYPLKGISSLQH